SKNEILAALTVENKERCRPPLPIRDVERIAQSVGRYPPAGNPPTSDWSTSTRSLSSSSGPRLVDPSAIELRDIEWFDRNFLRRNTFNLIQGHGGTNKGTWCCDVGARATRGEFTNGNAVMVLYAC